MGAARLLLALAAFLPGLAAARPVVSAGPQAVAVTVYRDRDRGVDEAMDLRFLQGFALVSEERVVDLPAGEAEIRFEGVAGGILPQSAIVTGLPGGVAEQNRDAWLLSPGSLLNASLGRRVHIRRTSRATGEVSEGQAVIRSGKDGAVVLETKDGVEALRCSGIPETLLYDSVPAGLSAKPTLAVRTRSRVAARVTLTLSYLATGFDWQADYIAQLSPDGQRMDLFAWLTLANGDETSFANADTQAVAGYVNRDDDEDPDEPEVEVFRLKCWPAGTTTSDLRRRRAPGPTTRRAAAAYAAANGDIVVTGSRIRNPNLTSSSPITVIGAEQLEVGDLKLYRVPIPVTVAAKSQKQVALLQRPGVKVRTVYRIRLNPAPYPSPAVERVIVTRNDKAHGLDLPLPGGRVAFFVDGPGRPLLLDRGAFQDRALGEEVEIELGAVPGVVAEVRLERGAGKRTRHYLLTVTNDRPHPISFEAELGAGEKVRARTRLERKNGRPVWRATVPANAAATFRWSSRAPRR
jgi:hypothetical protein